MSDFAPGSIEQIQHYARCAAISQVIAVAAELDLPALLERSAWTVADLAGVVQCDEDALRRLLRALASIGWCALDADDRVRLAANFARDDAQGFRAPALWWGRYRWPIWRDLLHSIRTGRTSIGIDEGRIGMHQLNDDPTAARIFHRTMASVTQRVAEALLRRCDLSGAQRIVDVGGGQGELLVAVLHKHPTAHGVLIDRPHALDGARQHLEAAGVLDRCEIVGGDFFERVPAGDAYLLKAILHDWSDADCARILQRCRDACGDGAMLVVVEQLLPMRIDSCIAHQRATISDLNMLVMLGGRERTLDEYRHMLAQAGFALNAVGEAALGFAVIEATATSDRTVR